MIKLKIEMDLEAGMKEINKFIASLNKIEKESVDYGYFNGTVHKTEHDKSGITEAGLMTILEFGSESASIPPRPVFTRTGENMQGSDNSKAFRIPLRNFVVQASQNKDNISKVLLDIGNIMRLATQANFGKGGSLNLEKNADKTIALKGRDDPLVHTGELRDSMKVQTSRGGSS